MTRYHLAQVNIGRARAPLEDAILEGFRSQSDLINALADSSPGFVRRLQTEDGNAMAIRPYADDAMAMDLSVWESFDSLKEFLHLTRSGDRPGNCRRAMTWHRAAASRSLGHRR